VWADLVVLSSIGSVEECLVLCFHDVESLLTAGVEFAARFAFSIELSLADYAYSAIAGETTADSPLCDVECGCDWIDYLSDLSNEVFAGAVNASVRVSRVLVLVAEVLHEEVRVQEAGVGIQVYRQLVDLGRVLELSPRCSLEHVCQTGFAGVLAVDEVDSDSRVAAGFRGGQVAIGDRCA
jgi:hypothetical protein